MCLKCSVHTTLHFIRVFTVWHVSNMHYHFAHYIGCWCQQSLYRHRKWSQFRWIHNQRSGSEHLLSLDVQRLYCSCQECPSASPSASPPRKRSRWICSSQAAVSQQQRHQHHRTHSTLSPWRRQLHCWRGDFEISHVLCGTESPWRFCLGAFPDNHSSLAPKLQWGHTEVWLGQEALWRTKKKHHHRPS